jgi:amino acid transporter
MATTAQETTPTRARLNLWDTTSLIVGIIIGAGIFRTPGEVFASVNGPWQAIGLWLLGGLVSLIGALCFAELASAYPHSGGEYVYLTRAFGRPVGFLFAWDQLALIRSAGSTGIIAYAFGEYTSRLLEIEQDTLFFNALFASAAITILTIVNILGVQMGKHTQNALTVLKIVSIGGLVAAGAAVAMGYGASQPPPVYQGILVGVDNNRAVLRENEQSEIIVQLTKQTKIWVNGDIQDDPDKPFDVAMLKGQKVRIVASPSSPDVAESIKINDRFILLVLGVALIPVMWTYAGWHEAAYVVAEVREERRTIPLALIMGTAAVVIIYLAIVLACLGALGFERAGEAEVIAADVLGKLGPFGAKAMALLVMISCLGATHGTIFTSSRIFAALGTDHPLFSSLSRWDPRWGTPVNALVVQGAISIGMVIFVCLAFPGKSPFLSLLFCTSAAFWVFFLLTGLSLFILRVRDRELPRPFRVPIYPVVPVLFCLACIGMIYASVHDFPIHSLVGLGIVLAGVPLYLVSEKMRKTSTLQPPP